MNNEICNLLDEGKIAHALILLKEKVENLHYADLIEDYYQLQNTYNAYLHVLILQDSFLELDKPYQFLQKAYVINDSAERRLRIQRRPNEEYCLSISNKDLFYQVWTSDLWTTSESQKYCNMLDTEDYITNSQLVSSTTLAILEMFDARKLEFLFEAYHSSNAQINKRAIVGIVLSLFKYSKRIYCFNEISNRLSLLSDSPEFINDVFQVLQILQYSKMTDIVDSTMKNDIMPTLLKSAQYNENLKSSLGNLKFSDEGENPEWINKKAEKKIQKMAEMQNEGADIYFTTFAHFKSTPFFHKLQNWLLPFDVNIAQNSEYDLMFRKFASETAAKFLDFVPFCDNDKYSFATLINASGGINTENILASISKDLPDDMSLDEIIKEKNGSNEQKEKNIIRSHIWNLYRLFTSYPKRHDLPNPFSKESDDFTPIGNKAFEFLTKHTKHLLELADFFMMRGVYGSALEIYQFINPQTKEEDADIWQKMGYCCQKTGNAKQALFYYQEADALCPGSQWTCTHISQTAREDKNYDLSIKYIDKLLQNDCDNIKYIYTKAEDLISLNKFEEAIPLLYKVTYLNDKFLPAHKSLAFSLLMTKSFDKAEKEFQKCIDLDDLKSLVDIGHTQLARNNIQKACKLFSQGFTTYLNKQKSIDDFINDFWNCGRYLVKLGIKQETINLVLETTLSRIL